MVTVTVFGAVVGCSMDDETSADEMESVGSVATAATDGTFDGFTTGRWREGSTYGSWRVRYAGYGSVNVKTVAAPHGSVLTLAPKAPSGSDTHAALVVGTSSLGDMDVQVSLKTDAQLRTKPNAWEMGWLVWHYTDDDHFYYAVLKPNGWEIGKRDPAYPGGQRFLATGGSPTYPAGAWHTLRVEQTGATMTISADGRRLTTLTDAERPYKNGALGLYTEDAIASFDDINVRAGSTPLPPAADAGPPRDSGSAPVDASPPPKPDASTTPPTPTPPPPPPGATEKMYGVTVDSVDNLSAIVDSLRRLPHKATTRIVFDENVPATQYTTAATQIQSVSYVMGELLDSFYVKNYSTAAYLARQDEYLKTLGSKVDIWEVGNEINGEWLGDTASVVAKMTGAYDRVKAAGKTTELTLYYNAGCFEKADHEMFTWAQANIPQRMKDGLDYVLISYYEDDCNGRQPDWNAVFTKLAQMFPNSKIGIGECGTTKVASKAAYITRYYGMTITAPRYVGGYFWWYFKQDMVPSTSGLWATLSTAMQ